MTGDLLLFWQPRSDLRLSPTEVAQELLFGEEVAGLVDLPVKAILGRLKEEFPEHGEQAGVLKGSGAAGTWEATWTWQHMRVECRKLDADDRQRLIDAIESFGCQAYEP
jgi:hypothetical protein